MSFTKRMKSGAVFGEGVYLAADLNVATSFAKGEAWRVLQIAPGPDCEWNGLMRTAGGRIWSGSALQADEVRGADSKQCTLTCVFVCEVINIPDNMHSLENEHTTQRPTARSATRNMGAYYVVKNPRHVRVVGLLVYSSKPKTRRSSTEDEAKVGSGEVDNAASRNSTTTACDNGARGGAAAGGADLVARSARNGAALQQRGLSSRALWFMSVIVAVVSVVLWYVMGVTL